MPNVFVIGQTGCGKSSVVNLIAGENVARTSPGDDLTHCTKSCTEYPISVSGKQFQVFDTFGFLEPDLDPKLYADAIADTYGAINASSGIDMVLYCIRDDKVEDKKTKNNYRLVHEVLCNEEVPIALVVTTRGGSMSTLNYKSIFTARNIACVDCICANITGTSGSDEPVDTKSQEAVRKLLVKCCEALESSSKLQKWWRAGKRSIGMGQSIKEKDVSSLLTRRCEMTLETAKLVIVALKPQLSSNRLYRGSYSRATTPESPSSKVHAPEEQEPTASGATSSSESPSSVDNASSSRQ